MSVTDWRTEWQTDRVQTYSPLQFHRWGTKKNFDDQKKLNFVLIYDFFILRSKIVVFRINIFAFIMFMGKTKIKLPKNSIFKKNWILNIVEWADISFDLLPQLLSLPQEVESYGFPTLNPRVLTGAFIRNKQTNFVTCWHLLIIYHLRTFCINIEEYMENVAPWN